MPTTFTNDAAGDADLEPGLSRVGADAHDRPEAGRDLRDQPEGDVVRRHADHWEDFYWQWKAQQRHQQGVPDLVGERLRGHRERREGQGRPRGRSSRSSTTSPTGSRSSTRSTRRRRTRTRRSSTRAGRTAADHGRPFKLDSIDHDGEDDHARAQREVVGRPREARHDRLPRHRPRRADRRARQRRDRRDGRRRRTPTSTTAPRTSTASRSASPAARTSGTSRSTARARTCRTCSVRQALAMAIDRARDRARAARAARDRRRSRSTTTSSWRIRTATRTTPATSARTTRRSAQQLLDEAGWKLEGNVRKKDGKPLEITMRHSERRRDVAAGVRADSEHARPDRRDAEDRRRAGQRLLRQVRHRRASSTSRSSRGSARRIRSARASRSTSSRQTNAEGRAGHPAELRARRLRRDRRAVRRRRTQELDRSKAIAIANRIDALIWQEVHSLTLYQRPELCAVQEGPRELRRVRLRPARLRGYRLAAVTRRRS